MSTSTPWRRRRAAFGAAILTTTAIAVFILLKPIIPNQDAGMAGVDWASYGGSSDETHHSALTQIDAGNVGRLGLTWSMDLPTMISTVGAPLAVKGTLYVPVGLSIVYALDAATGRQLWKYDAEVAKASVAALRPAWGIRGIAFGDGRLYLGTQDGRLLAIDPGTGKAIWSTQTTVPGDGLYITGAPRFFRDMVIIGQGGADFANVRGYVTAYDAKTGKQRWRFYTVPGNPANGFENEAMAMAAKSWTGQWWKLGGGGTPWNAITYDADLGRIYVGTGNGGPWNRKIRSPGGGDNLFLASIVALDARTGRYLWHYQENPGETWDYNSAMDIELVDLKVDGKPRKLLLHAPKNGFFYVIDRETGKLISAKPITKVTWASRIDLQTGRPIENPAARFPDGPTLVWPGTQGAHGPEPMAYNPATGWVYIPIKHLPALFANDDVDLQNWKREPGIDTGVKPFELPNLDTPADSPLGALLAWDPMSQTVKWSVPQNFPINGGILSTSGNLIFQGEANGRFIARNARTGKALWSFDAQDGIKAQPISYSVNGTQYVTVITGFGGPAADFGPISAKLGWDYRNQKRRVLTFKLGGTARLPTPVREDAPTFPDDAGFKIDPQLAREGHRLYYLNCMTCHGIEAVAGGGAPDLRRSSVPLNRPGFDLVVRQGALVEAGMPRFDALSDRNLDAIRNYIRAQARRSPRSAPLSGSSFPTSPSRKSE